jgi:hypothetical protein
LPLEEEERGENRLGFSWAKIGLPFGQEQRREKKNYFLFFLQTIFSPPFSKTCKLSCCLKYLEKSTFLKFTKQPWPSYISIEVPCILFWKL